LKDQLVVPATLEGIQMCAMNAERLLNDAQKGISEPTAVALLELSLEELSKAFALLFRHIDERFDAANRGKSIKLVSRSLGRKTLPQFSTEDIKKIKAATTTKNLGAPMTVEEFGDHSVKLERIQAVVRYVKIVTPIMMKYADRQSIVSSRGAGLVNLEAVEKQVGEQSEQYLGMINEEKIPELIMHKEKALYVDYDRTFRSPSTQVYPTAALAYLVGNLLAALKWDIQFYLDN
jgi:hypothetical protein